MSFQNLEHTTWMLQRRVFLMDILFRNFAAAIMAMSATRNTAHSGSTTGLGVGGVVLAILRFRTFVQPCLRVIHFLFWVEPREHSTQILGVFVIFANNRGCVGVVD